MITNKENYLTIMNSIQLAFTDIALDLLNATCYNIYGEKCSSLDEMCSTVRHYKDTTNFKKDLNLREEIRITYNKQNSNVTKPEVILQKSEIVNENKTLDEPTLSLQKNVLINNSDDKNPESETDKLITKIHENLSNSKKINVKTVSQLNEPPKTKNKKSKKPISKRGKYKKYTLNKNIKNALAKRNSKKSVRKIPEHKSNVTVKESEHEDTISDNEELNLDDKKNQNLMLLELKMKVDREYLRLSTISNKFMVEYEVLEESGEIESGLLDEYFQNERKRLANESSVLMDFIKYMKNHSQSHPKMKNIINTVLLLKELIKDTDTAN